jgi:hypothetical protein
MIGWAVTDTDGINISAWDGITPERAMALGNFMAEVVADTEARVRRALAFRLRPILSDLEAVLGAEEIVDPIGYLETISVRLAEALDQGQIPDTSPSSEAAVIDPPVRVAGPSAPERSEQFNGPPITVSPVVLDAVKQTRLVVNLLPDSVAALNSAASHDNISQTDVVNRALQIYETIAASMASNRVDGAWRLSFEDAHGQLVTLRVAVENADGHADGS